MPASFLEEQRLIRTLERTVRAMRRMIVHLGARDDLNADAARLQLGILEGFTVALPDVTQAASSIGLRERWCRAARWAMLRLLKRARWLAGIGAGEPRLMVGDEPMFYASPEYDVPLRDEDEQRDVQYHFIESIGSSLRRRQLEHGLRTLGWRTLRLDGRGRYAGMYGLPWEAFTDDGKRVTSLEPLDRWVVRIGFETLWEDTDEDGERDGEERVVLRLGDRSVDLEDFRVWLLPNKVSTIFDLETGKARGSSVLEGKPRAVQKRKTRSKAARAARTR
jgi:hypothetical protein